MSKAQNSVHRFVKAFYDKYIKHILWLLKNESSELALIFEKKKNSKKWLSLQMKCNFILNRHADTGDFIEKILSHI